MSYDEILINVCYWFAFAYSIILHEVAHGWVAKRCGDPTAEIAGRITLDPIPHIDPIMSILMPIVTYMTAGFAFGGAKPVPVNPYNFRNLELDDLKVSVAGVAVNFLIAAGCAATLHVWEPGTINYVLFSRIAILNLVLGIFNLVPIPPLDGSHVMRLFLSKIDRGVADAYESIGRFGFIIIMLGMGVLSPIIRTVLTFIWFHVFMLKQPY